MANSSHPYNMCNCDVCNKYKCFKEHLSTIPIEYHTWITALYEEITNIEMDLNYYKSLVDGSWADADAIIQQRRRNNVKRLAERRMIDPKSVCDVITPVR